MMCLGVFVQVNENATNNFAKTRPIGYIIQESGCWDWVGAVNSQGYGSWWADGISSVAHRVLYERAKGRVPDGLELDHLCRNRLCCNPDHLEAVTHQENVLRGDGHAAKCAKRTHCPQGHAYDAENTATYKGKRFCRACLKANGARHQRNYRARQKALRQK